MIDISSLLSHFRIACHPSRPERHPCLRVGDAGAIPDHRAKLSLILDRREIKMGQKWPSPLGIPHIALLAHNRIGAFTASESEHSGSPRRAGGRRPCEQPEVLSHRSAKRSHLEPYMAATDDVSQVPSIAFVWRSPSPSRPSHSAYPWQLPKDDVSRATPAPVPYFASPPPRRFSKRTAHG